MSFPICWRCLSNASARSLRQTARGSRPPTGVLALAFSTTPYVQFPLSPKKSSGVKVIHKKGSKSLVIKKGKRSDDNRVRRPAPGERKALRKRIVLSNVNAFEVEGMQDVNAENMYDGRLRGHVLGLPGPIVDQLRAAGAFKPSQAWGMFRRPGMLIRRETLEIGKIVADMHAENESKTQDITIGHTPYTPLASSSPINYVQPGYYAHLLQQISVANPHLADLPLSQEPSKMTIPVPIPPNISLAHFASLGASDREIAHPIFNLLVTELLSPGRPPVFFGLDGLAHAMQPATGYTAPHMTPIHPHNLEILKWYFEFLSGKKTLPNGGIIMAATSQSNAPKVPALDVALSQLEGPIESPAGQAVPSKERIPFVKYDEGVFKTLIGGEKAIEIRRLEGLSKEETRGLLEYWARSGMLRERVTEGFLGEKWALSGGGVVGELERAVVRMRV
ncbi:MAG: hypothetical protein Q9179_000465 [Wetmoreana sp. 5 TL-2023]